MISTYELNSSKNEILNSKINGQGHSLSKTTLREMTPEEQEIYDNLTKDCTQLSIFDFIEQNNEVSNV